MKRLGLALLLLVATSCRPQVTLELRGPEPPEIQEWREAMTQRVNDHDRRLEALERGSQ